MNVNLLMQIHSAGSQLISNCPPPPGVADGWVPFVPEPLQAAIAIEEHRWFWRPNQVKFVLLAESHVYTDSDDLQCKINRAQLPPEAKNAPDQFVRLVYCLGYGNDSILNRAPLQKNSGTKEYWEIFGRCADTWDSCDSSLSWKVKTLEALKAKGIWLADASIHACMNPRRERSWRNIASRFRITLYRDLINLSWGYVRPTVKEAKEIWYIGKNLRSVLHDDILCQNQFIPQPAGRRNPKTRQEYEEKFPELINAIDRVCG